jgi:hypothetical protein
MVTKVMLYAAIFASNPLDSLAEMRTTIWTCKRLAIYGYDTGVPVEEAKPVLQIYQWRTCSQQTDDPPSGNQTGKTAKDR